MYTDTDHLSTRPDDLMDLVRALVSADTPEKFRRATAALGGTPHLSLES